MRWRPLCGLVFAGLLGTALGSTTADAYHKGVSKMDFGKTSDGQPVEMFVLETDKLTVKVITYGAIITEIDAPDRDGKKADVVLGFDDLKSYLAGHPFFGAVAGRVANRIAKGKFTLEGKEYTLATNNGPNTLHGGLKGFDKAVWKAEELKGGDGPAVRLTHVSPDGDEGFPGTLTTSITYTVTDKGELRIDYQATTDKTTIVNLTQHSYFNLAGPASGSILDHELTLAADSYTPGDENLIPSGAIEPVKGTPLDFTSPTPIGKHINEIKADPVGYDHNYVLRTGDGKTPHLAAKVREPKSGRVMEVFTTEPGVQLYTANFLDGSIKGKGGVTYKKHQGFCLETQHYPDSIHHPGFPSTVLEPGKTYTQTTIFKFSAE
jgi:aldose 1-epimerase